MGKTLSIVVPAYNEEESIKEILERCLGAAERLRRETGLELEVIAVNDGSRDKTSEIAGRVAKVKLVNHEVNRGYGEALKTGFNASSGDYLGFLDADGTCDPLAFIGLYKALQERGADLSIGNRLHKDSKMPRIRYIGNRIYAVIISWLTGVPVSDTASGMRLFAKGLAERFAPLPSGLHFTPAMTAQAACLGTKIVETPIPYAERQGQSKLNVVADGVRFLRVILGIIFAYYPLRVFGPVGIFFAAVAVGYGLQPVSYYLSHGRLEPDVMIYRLLTIVVLLSCGFISLTYGWIAQRISDIANHRPSGWLEQPRLHEASAAVGCLLGLGGIALNSKTILEYVSSGQITTHWVYLLTGGLCVILGTVLSAFGVVLGLMGHLSFSVKPAVRP